MSPEQRESPILRGGAATAGIALVLGVAALAVMIWAFRADPLRAFHSYLTAYTFVLSLIIGSAAFAMISHAANATWPVAMRRLAEAVGAAMPVMVLLFLPIVLGIRVLYPWAHMSEFEPRVRELLRHRAVWMNPGGFVIRAGLYLLFWSALSLLLRNWSIAMERDGGARAERLSVRLRRLSYAALPISSLVTAMIGFEWLMSLSPEFASTMFGALWIATCLFGGLACVVVLTGITQRSSSPLRAANPSHYSALGRLLFAFLIFLGYTVFFQYMLGWMANRPSEAEWYLQRGQGVYYASTMFLIFGHFALPFLVLLSFRLKRQIDKLTWVAVWCLIAQYLHLHWLITPASKEPGFSWLDPVALVAVLGITTAVGLLAQRGKALAPNFDPRYAQTFSYESR